MKILKESNIKTIPIEELEPQFYGKISLSLKLISAEQIESDDSSSIDEVYKYKSGSKYKLVDKQKTDEDYEISIYDVYEIFDLVDDYGGPGGQYHYFDVSIDEPNQILTIICTKGLDI